MRGVAARISKARRHIMSSTNSENSPAPHRRIADTTRRIIDAVQRGEVPGAPAGGRYLGWLAGGEAPPLADTLYARATVEPADSLPRADVLPGLVSAYSAIRAQGERIFTSGEASSVRAEGALAALGDAEHTLSDMIRSTEPLTAAGAAALIEFAIFQLVDDLPCNEELAPEGVATLQRATAFLKGA
jgi:hypothetical protein